MHENIENALNDIHADVKDIRNALVGTYNDFGLVTRVKNLESFAGDIAGVKQGLTRVALRFAIIGVVSCGGIVAAVKMFM